MPDELRSFITAGEGSRPHRVDGLRWWCVDDWPEASAAASGMWPGKEYWREQEWRDLYADGYRYCALLRDGHSLAVAGLWPRTEPEWEVIAVGTAPGHRSRGKKIRGKSILPTGRCCRWPSAVIRGTALLSVGHPGREAVAASNSKKQLEEATRRVALTISAPPILGVRLCKCIEEWIAQHISRQSLETVQKAP